MQNEDESTKYVLPNHMLLHVAEAMPLTVGGLISACSPVPPLVRVHAHALVAIIGTVFPCC